MFARDFVRFVGPMAVAALPNLVLYGTAAGPEVLTAAEVQTTAVRYVLAIALALVLGQLAQAAILYGAFQDMRGRPVQLGESLRKGFVRLLPILGLAICYILAVGLGSILLIVPGLILMTMWFVSLPACVVEKLGPLGSLGRSRRLTQGHRWKIFGILLLLLVVSFIGGAMIGELLAAVGGLAASAFGQWIWNSVWGVFYALVIIIAYHDLRVAKEGVDIEQIAAVFD
jgi:hypothetical protein